MSSVIESRRWSPARAFLLVIAVSHVVLGIAGLIVNRSFPIGPAQAKAASSGYIFGVLESNGWHAVAALGIGLVAAWFVAKPAGARAFALALGASHVVIVIFLAIVDPTTSMIASNDADQIVHAFTAIGGLASGVATPR